MKLFPRSLLFQALPLAFLCLLSPGFAAPRPDFDSHQVNADGSVTFRYYAPQAGAVTMSLDYDHTPLPFKKGADGVWTFTTGPLQPALHIYGLAEDGVAVMDPLNDDVEVNYNFKSNYVRVKGTTPQLWDVSDVGHGTVHHHVLPTTLIKGLPDGLEDFYVYTPPGYDPTAPKRYPVLYLLHGWSGTAEDWISAGQANVILDNLIAQQKAVPMIVVMPLGYGDMAFVKDFGVWNDPAAVANNIGQFRKALVDIEKTVEGAYRTLPDRDHRAIAGLSMGGGESLVIGLNHPDEFGWIGGFSSAVVYDTFDGVFPNLGSLKANPPKLLWIACGTEDQLISYNRKFEAWLGTMGVKATAVETPGIHNWPVWRDNLIHFAPLLFRQAPDVPSRDSKAAYFQ
jgi:enterochelin esterase family protein